MPHFEIAASDTCPSCGHTSHTYKRYLHKEMALFLEALNHAGGKAHSRQIIQGATKSSTDASYLVHWGFVRKPGKGIYEITPKGLRFLCGCAASEYILMKDGELVGRSNTTTTYKAVTGK